MNVRIQQRLISSTAETTRLGVVDGLRGISILLVIYQHAFASSIAPTYQKITGLDFPYIITNGWMGVSFFFVLSGFVLALPYLSEKRDISAVGGIKKYYEHRARRLFPLFMFMSFVSLAFFDSKGEGSAHNSLLMTISMSSMFSVKYFFPEINPAFWSLLVEISFSIILPAILISINRFGLKSTAIAVAIAAVSLRIYGSYFDFGMIQINPVKDFVIARSDDFVAGIIVCYLYVNRKLPGIPGVLVIIGLSLIAAAALIWDMKTQGHFPNFVIAFTNNLTSIGFCLILAAALKSRGIISKILSMWWLRIIGAMCFSVYCWHLLLISDLLLHEPMKLKVQVQFWLTLFVLSSVTFRYIECFNEKSLRKVFMLEDSASKVNCKVS